MTLYLTVSGALLAWLMLAFFLGSLLGLQGRELWILRGGLTLLGIAAAAVYLWYRLKSDAAAASTAAAGLGGEKGVSGGEGEADVLAREASSRLAASSMAKGATLATLPAVLVIGPEGSAKTTSVVRSGLEMELLAGHVYQDNAIIPTRSANFWFSRGVVFAEAGGKLLANSAEFGRWIRRLAASHGGA